MRVAAAAYRETGRPVITHTTAGTMGYEQASLLIELGVDAHRITLSHMDTEYRIVPDNFRGYAVEIRWGGWFRSVRGFSLNTSEYDATSSEIDITLVHDTLCGTVTSKPQLRPLTQP